MKDWRPLAALALFIASCGGEASSDDAVQATGGGGDSASGGTAISGGDAVGGGAAASGGGETASGGSTQGSEYYFDAVIDGIPYSLKDNLYARPIPSGFELYAESEAVDYGFLFSFKPDHLGVYECGGDVSYMATRIETSYWLDLFGPEGICTVQFTEVGSVFRGTFSGELYHPGNTAPQIVSAGRFYVPLE